jgi:hypothetical protein
MMYPKSQKKTILVTAWLLASLLLSACGLSEADVAPTIAAARTEAIQTMSANFTQVALLTPSATATLAATNTPAFTNTPEGDAPTATTAAGGTGGDTGCTNLMGFVEDVSVPDGTSFSAGEDFTKTWRIINNGTCTWTVSYYILFLDGEQMAGPDTQAMTITVEPGATIDISVNLEAPSTAGTYRGDWGIADEAGTIFGSFYLEIVVG